ncbi:hypothetical protein ACFV2I_33500 [Streptomyces microflavus]|uniref:hypothetical protein n=1 Tax=Streptomyces microflavus TaxID=1919 RepID=UPI003682CC23|nr:hypothetical protein [Streptomyces sp. 09ZI22]
MTVNPAALSTTVGFDLLATDNETGEGEDHLLTLGPVWDTALESEDDADAWQWATFELAPQIARHLGTGPPHINSETASRSVGLIALTPYGVAHVPKGTYCI